MTRKLLSIALILMMTLTAAFSACAETIHINLDTMTPQEQYDTGMQYYDINPAVAFVCWKAAAEAGHVDGMFSVGTLYWTGDGTEQNTEMGIYWLTRAAEAGRVDAYTNLGVIAYSSGDLEAAAAHWLAAAEEDNTMAMSYLASVAYEQNDMATAITWWEQAGELGHIGSILNLVQIYQLGIGVPEDNVKAAKWLQKGVDVGDVQCTYVLGIYYENGVGVEQSYEKAFDLYLLAAKAGHAEAACNVGWCYDTGNGTQPSAQQAKEWYRVSAEGGDAMGKYNYAATLLKENGNKATDEIIQLLEDAYQLGYEPAADLLDQVR